MQELGESTARQTARLASRNILYHRRRAHSITGVDQEAGIFLSSLFFHEFESSLVQNFKPVKQFGLVWEFCEIRKICNFRVPSLLLEN